MSKALTGALVFLCLFAAAVPSMAQTRGRIRGQVTDSADEFLPGVTVTLLGDKLHGAERVVVTNEAGSYRFSQIPVGSYSVQAGMDGFQTQRVDDVRVNMNSSLTVNFQLPPSEFLEEVTVLGESPLVDTTSSSVGTNYSEEFLKEIPTNRNFYDLMSVSPGVATSSEGSDRQIAFGSNMQSNSWHIDGLETTAPETGTAWVYVNPDMIEEIQVLGVGAGAQFGNMTGAAFNVVTKSGTNQFRGSANYFVQTDSLTGTNVKLEDTEFPSFERNKFYDATATAGGPVVRDSLWYFAAVEFWRDNAAQPAEDPSQTPTWYSDRYDLKLTASLNPRNTMNLKVHFDDWGFPDPADPFVEPSARGGEIGDNWSVGLDWQSVLSNETVLEVKLGGWSTNDDNLSQTGSTDPAFIDYSPPGGGPPLYGGGLWYPWTYDTWHRQADATLSHFADDLAGEHDFKFGVTYSRGNAETTVAPSATGTYYYNYTYSYDYYGYIYDYDYFVKAEGSAYLYGAEQTAFAIFADDSWSISEGFTLNLGLRWDRHEAKVPGYPKLDGEGNPTGESFAGINPVFTWNNVSPRLGFAYNLGADLRTVIRGAAGIYYDGNVSGNWNYPPPDGAAGLDYFLFNDFTQEFDYWYSWSAGEVGVDPNLKAPRTVQYSLGFEHQLGPTYAVGAMVVYKDSKDLVGWQILDDGIFEPVPYTDPFTGNQYILQNQIQQPTVRKGNSPGFTADPANDRYYQDYKGLVLTFNRRLSNNWSMMASYTLSESTGVIPRMLSQTQFNPFYSNRGGSDPNNFINADQHLQGDRRNMLRAQATWSLPHNWMLSTNLNLQDGRPYSRQIRVPLDQGLTTVIMEPGSDRQRHAFQSLWDLAVGKRFILSNGTEFKIDAQILNLLNNDAEDFFETLVLQEGDEFVPDTWLLPRRVMLRFGVAF